MARLIAFSLVGVAVAAAWLAVKPAEVSAATLRSLTRTDARLLVPVTLEAQQKPLYAIASQLTALTGVTIRTGRDDKDWPVRDIPQTISVKEIPLGRLLQAMADVSHLQLSVEAATDLEGKPVRTYRIWQDSRMRRAIDDYVAGERQRTLDRQAWAWDALVKMGRLGAQPGLVAAKDADEVSWGSTPEIARMFGRMLASLGREGKKRAMAGQPVEIQANDLSDPSILRDFYTAVWDRFRAYYLSEEARSQASSQPAATDLRDASITIFMAGDPINRSLGINMPLRMGEVSGAWYDSFEWMAKKAGQGVERAPDRIKKPRLTDPMECRYRGFAKVTFRREDVTSPLSRMIKLDIPKPAAGTTVTFAATVCGIARASGMDLVAEDFESHVTVGALRPIEPKAEMRIDDALGRAFHNWYFNSDLSLLLGPSHTPLQNQRNLMPERVLSYLKNKASTTGVQLDDIMLLAPYAEGQLSAWFPISRDLAFMSGASHWYSKRFWRLWASLTPQDKARALSAQGLPLAKLDTIWVKGRLQRPAGTNIQLNSHEGETAELKRREAQEKRQEQILADARALRKLTLRVISSEASEWRIMAPVEGGGAYTRAERLPEGQHKQRYDLEVSGTVDGQPFSVKEDGFGLSFPLYTPERQAELLKKEKQ